MDIRTTEEMKPLRPSWLRARLAKWAVLPYKLGLGALLGREVMILTTRGRITGRARKTPLWYARDGGVVYCFSGWGSSSDWLKNLKADASALVRIGHRSWETRAVLVEEFQKRDAILQTFLKKHGRLVRVFYHMDRLVLVAFPLEGAGAQEASF